MQLKQYSCYCGMCSEKRYSECPHLATTRSRKHEPKKAGLARTRWLETGWVEYSMKLKEDTEARKLREITSKQRLDFIKGLKVGDVIGVYCGGTGDVDHTFFWLAKVQAKSRADAAIGDSPVLFKAAVRDEGWDIEASEFILNIQWLKRMGRAKWWGLAGEQIITLTSVLPVRVQWKNTSTYQYQLSDPQHEELLHLCKCVRVLEPNFQRAADGQ